MSHFAGFVILTPSYAEFHDLEDSLKKYDENLKVPEYSRGEVSDYDKIIFIEYYLKEFNRKYVEVKEKLYSRLLEENKLGQRYCQEDGNWERYLTRITYENKEEYTHLFKEQYKEQFDKFEELYKEHGDDWNSNQWRKNPISGKWEEHSTYNPYSKYDWYDEDGRWSDCIKTKSDEYVNECFLREIDWTDFKPEDYEEEEKTTIWGKKYKPLKENVKYHFTKSDLPFCLVIDGEYISKGDMVYWGMTSNEMTDEEWNKKVFEILERLPKNSRVYNIDFHI